MPSKPSQGLKSTLASAIDPPHPRKKLKFSFDTKPHAILTTFNGPLSFLSVEADVVADGLEAVELFTARRYDLALLDLGLPGLAGDEVAAKLKSADPETVTVVMTGWTLDADDPRMAGFDLSIRKPFETHEILDVIARALEPKKR